MQSERKDLKHTSELPSTTDVDTPHSRALASYLDTLRRWNTVRNLVSKKDLDFLYERHVKDSLALLPHIEHSNHHLDLGSGAGFPGIPIAICRDDLRVVLVDKSRNKCRFLRQVQIHLKLDNVKVHELDVQKANQLTDKFDSISIRAVAPPMEAWGLALPFLSDSGHVLLQTSVPCEDLKLPNGKVRWSRKSERGWITSVVTEAQA